MCEAWDGAMLMYKDEGIREGEKSMARRIAKNMYRRGYSLEDTAGLTGIPVKEVGVWFKEFHAN